MKSSILLTVLMGFLICISPIFGKDEFLGAFKNKNHGIAGDIYSKGDNQLVIDGFEYDGTGPDAFFWVGTRGKTPSSDGIILPHPFQGTYLLTYDVQWVEILNYENVRKLDRSNDFTRGHN